MEDRHSQILQAVVREYIKYARPVSSVTLARRYRPKVSSATIRNEFAELTKEGYLAQPHTSAGRIPTNRGYRYYVDARITAHDSDIAANPKRLEAGIEEIVQALAISSGLLASAWREGGETMFFGLKQVLSQPEFASRRASVRLAEIIDTLPDTLSELFSLPKPKGIMIGSECPFWDDDSVSVIFRKVKFPDRAGGVACIIGPTRMSYEISWQLLE